MDDEYLDQELFEVPKILAWLDNHTEILVRPPFEIRNVRCFPFGNKEFGEHITAANSTEEEIQIIREELLHRGYKKYPEYEAEIGRRVWIYSFGESESIHAPEIHTVISTKDSRLHGKDEPATAFRHANKGILFAPNIYWELTGERI